MMGVVSFSWPVAAISASACLALFRLGDEIRPEAKPLIEALHEKGRQVVLLTGDAPSVAGRVAGT
ncbi:MAG: HAD family hydrolase, partial [Anaerolineales bacterium]|nr:HAD family hydrolase [Anaerolineales bacterium]